MRGADRAAWRSLAARAGPPAAPLHPGELDALPDPARRLFRAAIGPGRRPCRVAEIAMTGSLDLGTPAAPQPWAMAARQILAPPDGFIWRVRARRGPRVVAGSDGLIDGRSWSRVRLFALIPVVRAGGDADHARSALGRLVGEAAIWTPAALLPRFGALWTAVDADTARAAVTWCGMDQSVDVTVDGEGRPRRVVLPRWSDANAERTYRRQPFGGDLAEVRAIAGLQVPTRVTGGHWIGTEAYHPFYRVQVTGLTWLDAS